MPVWTDVKNDKIASFGGAKFAYEVRFGERDMPYFGQTVISPDVTYADRRNRLLSMVSAVLFVYQIRSSSAVAFLLG